MSKITKEILLWLSVNLFLPIALPVLILALTSLIIKSSYNDFYSLFGILLDRGIFLFVGITLLFSLYQDYDKDISSAFPPLSNIIISGFLLLTTFLFISSLGIIDSQYAVTLEDNRNVNTWCLILSIIFSIGFKRRILKVKLKKSYNYVN